jgi:predicted N-acetyltransferase YhbS
MEPPMSKVIIRKFQEGDEEKALKFLKTVFGGWHSLRQWYWKFREVERIQGHKSIIWVMEVDGKIVGHLAAIPMKLRVGPEVFPVCQLVDGVSSPEYRHKGLYKDLFGKLLSDAVEEGFAATFGFPNIFFYRVCERQGTFQPVCQIKKMFKVLSFYNAVNTLRIRLFSDNSERVDGDSPLKEILVAQRGKAFSVSLDLIRKILSSTLTSIRDHGKPVDKAKLKKIEPQNLGAELHAAWVDFSPHYRFAFERDPQFLRWRYSSPEAKYTAFVAKKGNSVGGYVVVGIEEKSVTLGRLKFSGLRAGYIVDLVAKGDLMVPLILAAEEELKKQGACFAECWATDEKSSFFRTLQTRRYYQLPDQLYRVYFVAKVDSPRLKTSIAPEYSNEILVSLGDSDIV